jgi:hypothetical protein
MRFGKNPNQPETGVSLRRHVVRTDTNYFAARTGERGNHSDADTAAHAGYRVLARRPRSRVCDQAVDPRRADEIEAFIEGTMPGDRWY